MRQMREKGVEKGGEQPASDSAPESGPLSLTLLQGCSPNQNAHPTGTGCKRSARQDATRAVILLMPRG